jgi:hypothetical protein
MICENQKRIIVFDLDETLGYFTQFGMLWDTINEYNKHIHLNIEMNQTFFNKLLNLYPEFLRPQILRILEYLKQQKEAQNCQKILIYTNNQAPKQWAYFIKNYFEDKINYPLFDQVIGAFKVNGKIIEICRTTNKKTKDDLIHCSKINSNSKICFIDDTYYPNMTDENIYYINLKPYIYDLPFDVLIERLNDYYNMDKQYLLNNLNSYNYILSNKNSIEYNMEKALSKKLYKLLHKFFQEQTNKNKNCNNTRKNKNINKNKYNKTNKKH